jgi:hypothetical protein
MHCIYFYTGQHKHRINTHRHLCFAWDSNPGSQAKIVRASDRSATAIGEKETIADDFLYVCGDLGHIVRALTRSSEYLYTEIGFTILVLSFFTY